MTPRLAPEPPGSPDRNARRRARTRAALLGAARHLFAERGPEQTTIAEIAERADTAIGSFYNYFRTKEDLLAALLEETLSAQNRLMDSRRTGITDAAEAISVAHRHFVGLTLAQPEWAWLLVRLDVTHHLIDRALAATAMSDLGAGIRSGRFRVASPELALRASGGAMLAVMHALLLGELGPEADSEHAEGVLRSFGLDPEEAAEIARRPMPAQPEQERGG